MNDGFPGTNMYARLYGFSFEGNALRVLRKERQVLVALQVKKHRKEFKEIKQIKGTENTGV